MTAEVISRYIYIIWQIAGKTYDICVHVDISASAPVKANENLTVYLLDANTEHQESLWCQLSVFVATGGTRNCHNDITSVSASDDKVGFMIALVFQRNVSFNISCQLNSPDPELVRGHIMLICILQAEYLLSNYVANDKAVALLSRHPPTWSSLVMT